MDSTDLLNDFLESDSFDFDSYNALVANMPEAENMDWASWLNGFAYGTYAWFYWGVLVIYLISSWVVFQKAGKPGWAAIVPIYNTLVFLNIVGRPWWWIFLFLIPIVGFVFAVIATHDLSLAFKRSGWFTAGLLVFPWIFFPILAFGHDTYTKPTRV